MTKEIRLWQVNQLIEFISQRGRNFFRSNALGEIIIQSDKYYYVDDYSLKKIYMWNHERWAYGFSGGGTLKRLLLNLKDYIITGNPLNFIVLPRLGGGNVWEYPESDVLEIEEYARKVGIRK